MHLSKDSNNGQPKAFKPDHHLFSPNTAVEMDANPYDGGEPSSPTSAYFFSAPSSPMHFVLSTFHSPPSNSIPTFPPAFDSAQYSSALSESFNFDFSSNFSPNASIPSESMMPADELFFNGQIRPMKLNSSHLQAVAPLLDLEAEDEQDDGNTVKDAYREDSVMRGRDLSSRNRSLRRKTRSVSPLRTGHFFWQDDSAFELEPESVLSLAKTKKGGTKSMEAPPPCSSSSSRSSSSGRNSNKWMFLKDLLRRSKSERGAGDNKNYDTFSAVKERKLDSSSLSPSSSRREKDKNGVVTEKQKGSKEVRIKKAVSGKPANGVVKRASAHELHYTANRAQAEEMKKKTYLPYRQGLLGCLGVSSKGYGALNGFAKTLNPVSSRYQNC